MIDVAPSGTSSVDKDEIARFSAMAAEWWDPTGKFAPLHKFNPTRLNFIRERVVSHFGLESEKTTPFEGINLLDIGCGGGLLSEPMTRLGANVVGADAGEANIKTARVHAEEQGLNIDYRVTTAEDLAASGAQFDIILNMEVIEHVADRDGFLLSCSQMLKPGGILFCATLNRSLKAFGLAIVGAEYILRWLPKGTHDWNKFITPAELFKSIERTGIEVVEETGVTYNPLSDRWSLSTDMGVNYMMVATKPKPTT